MTASQVKYRLSLSMNGICAESIRNSSLGYAKTLGVDWVRIREIASEFEKDYGISVELWNSDVREHRLIATLLCPYDQMTVERLREWMKGVTNTELAEILSFALLSRITALTDELIQMEESDIELYRLTAYLSLGRMHNFGNAMSDETFSIVKSKINPADRNNLVFVHAIESLEQCQ